MTRCKCDDDNEAKTCKLHNDKSIRHPVGYCNDGEAYIDPTCEIHGST
jgi:hypothetical protein